MFGSIFLKDEDVNKKLDAYDKKAYGVGKKIGGMELSFGSAGKALANFGKLLGGLGVGLSLGKMITDTVKYADEVGLMSEKTSMSVKSIQELRYVTNQLDMDFGVVQNSITQFTNRLRGADKDSSAVAVALQKLGISTKDLEGNTRPIPEMYEEVISKLSGVANESDRNILASTLFGKSFSEMVPLLKAGSRELSRLRKEANDLGVVMSNEDVAAARKFGDVIDSLKLQFQAMGYQIGKVFMPIIQNGLVPLFKDVISPVVKSVVIPVFQGFANAIKIIKDNIQAFMPIIVAAGAAMATYILITKGALVIEALSKAWRIASASLALFRAGAKLTTIAQMALNKSFLLSPITWIVAGVAALAAAAYLLIKNWDKAAPFFSSLWVVLKNAFSTGGAGVMVVVRAIQLGLANFLDFTAGNLLALYSGLFDFLARIPGIGDAFRGVQSGINELRSTLKGFVKSSEEDLNDAKANIKTTAGETAQAWVTMTKAAAGLGTGIGNTFEIMWNGIKKVFKSGNDGIVEITEETGDEIVTTVEEDAAAAADAAKEALDRRIKDLDSFGAAITKALRKWYDTQGKIETTAIEDSLDREKDAHNKKLKLYNEEYKARLKSLNAGEESALAKLQTQIDAINNLTDAESKAIDEQEYRQKIADLRGKILLAENNEDRISLQKELDGAIADREREALLDSRQLQIEQFETEMEAIRKRAQNDEDALQEEYDRKKEAADAEYDLLVTGLNNKKDAIQSHYQTLTDEEALQAEARKLVLGKDQKEIIELLSTFNPGWQDAGQSFGESLLIGLNSMKGNIATAVGGLLSLASGTGGRTSAIDSGSSQGGKIVEIMKRNSAAWKSASPAEKKRMADENLEYGTSMGWSRDGNGVWHKPDGTRAYAEGTSSASPGLALVGERGPELVEFHGGEKVIPNNELGGTAITLNVQTDNPSDMRQARKYGEAIVNFLQAKGVTS